MRQLKIVKQITNRESQSLEKYLQEIGRVDLISAEEETILAQRIREGDQVALAKLVKANLRFVVSVAKQYKSRTLSLGDLINEGNVGLVKAASRFDETRGFKFISYAVWWIRQAILQALAEQARIIRLPLNRVNAINKISKTFSELEQKYEREPTNDELAEEMDVNLQELKTNVQISALQISLDAPFGSSQDSRLADVLENENIDKPDQSLMKESLHFEIQKALSTLNLREAEILSNYYGLENNSPMTLEEIGLKFGITRERVRQIKEKGIRLLRSTSRSKGLRNYLGQ